MDNIFTIKKTRLLEDSTKAVQSAKKTFFLYGLLPISVLVVVGFMNPSVAFGLFFFWMLSSLILLYFKNVFSIFRLGSFGEGRKSVLDEVLNPIDRVVNTAESYGETGFSTTVTWQFFQGSFIVGNFFLFPNLITLPAIYLFTKRLDSKLKKSKLTDDDYERNGKTLIASRFSGGVIRKAIFGLSFFAIPILVLGGYYGIKHGRTLWDVNAHRLSLNPGARTLSQTEWKTFLRGDVDVLKPIAKAEIQPTIDDALKDGSVTYNEQQEIVNKLEVIKKKFYGTYMVNEKTQLLPEYRNK